MLNVGKKAAGRLLDGVTHDGMPVASGSGTPEGGPAERPAKAVASGSDGPVGAAAERPATPAAKP